MRFINAGFVPIGSLLGGFIGDLYGLRAALVVGVAGMFVAFFFVLLSATFATRATACGG